MSSSLIGKEAISRVQMWQRQTTVPGEPQLRGSRFAQLVGFAIIEQLTQARTPEEIINIVEKAASNCLTELGVYYNGFGDERARASAKSDSHIDKLWLIRALISPQRAAEENLFDRLYGDLVEDPQIHPPYDGLSLLFGESRQPLNFFLRNCGH